MTNSDMEDDEGEPAEEEVFDVADYDQGDGTE